MTQDEIIELAKPYEWLGAEGWTFNHYWQLKEFAKLIAAKAVDEYLDAERDAELRARGEA